MGTALHRRPRPAVHALGRRSLAPRGPEQHQKWNTAGSEAAPPPLPETSIIHRPHRTAGPNTRSVDQGLSPLKDVNLERISLILGDEGSGGVEGQILGKKSPLPQNPFFYGLVGLASSLGMPT
ncbi:hypothetical protein SCMU_00520 [Sinomonas cyclohexanicum]|uniref:Uncharacterized protein n=1 Tax=Sinomonas cyclohexanicum TaxID=322009 RepID=A0ABM7PQ81_SINCY|nr:hypothetical protein SCMU_00520 [Corynebacterium cyclohexanicum]